MTWLQIAALVLCGAGIAVGFFVAGVYYGVRKTATWLDNRVLFIREELHEQALSTDERHMVNEATACVRAELVRLL